jgi:hypothetical protein
MSVGLELENPAVPVDGFRLEDFVVFAATVNVGDRVAAMKGLDRHQLGGLQVMCFGFHTHTVGQ